MAKISILTLSIKATAALTAHRFITAAGAVPAAAANCIGVADSAAAIGEMVPVIADGVADVEVGAAVAVDQRLQVDAQGRVIPFAAGKIVGVALAAATTAGQKIEVRLVPN